MSALQAPDGDPRPRSSRASALARLGRIRSPELIFPIYERLTGRHPWAELQHQRVLQWQSPAAIEARALRRLPLLLEHARTSVPYYRELFRSVGCEPGDVRSLADLARLPVVGKAGLRAEPLERITAAGLRAQRGRAARTAGSTGFPFEFFTDKASDDRVLGSFLLFREWAGAPLGQTQVFIAGPKYARNIARSSAGMALARRLAFGERLLEIVGMELSAAEFLARLRRLPSGRPYFVFGFPSYIARVARRLLECGAALPARPSVVVICSETLTAADRATIGQAFGAPVVNHYSTWEVPHLAQSCPDNPELLHLSAGRALVRIARADGSAAQPGEAGRVLITDLWNEVMPFINYELGDWAAAGGPCPCGRGLPTLTHLEGRLAEAIQTPSGRTISPITLGRLITHEIDGLAQIWEYQVVQTTLDRVVLRVVPRATLDADVAARLRAVFETALGPGMTVEVETVARIPTEASGKRFIVKCELDRS